MHLANPAAIRQYEGLKYSGDFTDAAHLAQLLRLGLLPEGYIYPPQERPVRDLSRKRMQPVQCRTAQILAIENLFSRQTGGQMQGEGEEIGLIEKRLMGAGQTAPGLCLTEFGARDWPGSRDHDHAGNRNHFAFCQGWQFQFVLPLRGQPGAKATAGRKELATRRTATSIWHGHLSRRPTSPSARARKSGAFTGARNAREMGSSRSRRWRTSWRAPAITCFRSTSHLR